MTNRWMRSSSLELFSMLSLCAVVAVGIVLPSNSLAQVQKPASYVKVVDDPGRVPWETRSQVLPNAGGCWVATDCYNYSDTEGTATFELRPVPEGKRWIVKSATGMMVNGNGRVNNIELGGPRGGIAFDGVKWAFGGPFFPATHNNAVVYNVEMFAEFGPGEIPVVQVSATPGLGGYTVIVFNGYLIDAH